MHRSTLANMRWQRELRRDFAVGAALSFVCLGMILAGCGAQRVETVPVEGKVSWEGQPADHGSITFYPATGRPAVGAIQTDGSYKLTTLSAGDGAVTGNHTVTIEVKAFKPQSNSPKSFEEELQTVGEKSRTITTQPRWIIPETYARRNTTPLVAEVPETGAVIDFHLP